MWKLTLGYGNTYWESNTIFDGYETDIYMSILHWNGYKANIASGKTSLVVGFLVFRASLEVLSMWPSGNIFHIQV
jgi:hypothetical protein